MLGALRIRILVELETQADDATKDAAEAPAVAMESQTTLGMPVSSNSSENSTLLDRLPSNSTGGERMSEDVTREYLIKIGILKGMLVYRSRNGSPSEKEYASLRAELVAIPIIRYALPRFVLKCRTIQEFWAFIKPKFATWKERTGFLQQEFDPLMTALEQGEAPSSHPLRS